MPSVFIRTSGCNLRCSWCDTPYTSWQPEGNELNVEEILRTIEPYGAAYAVVTGGEPMIAPGIAELTSLLHGKGMHVTIETAGTVHHDLACDLMSISPKLKNSVPYDREQGRWAAQHDRLRYQPSTLKRLAADYACQFKFVVTGPDDLAEIEAMQAEVGFDPRDVILMAEGTDAATLRERARWIVEVCKARHYRFSPRIHVDIWGALRGV